MSRHAIVNQDGLVVNVIEWEGAEWLPPKDHYVVFSPICDIGDTYDLVKDEFIRPNRISKDPEPITEEPTVTLESLKIQLDSLKSQLNM